MKNAIEMLLLDSSWRAWRSGALSGVLLMCGLWFSIPVHAGTANNASLSFEVGTTNVIDLADMCTPYGQGTSTYTIVSQPVGKIIWYLSAQGYTYLCQYVAPATTGPDSFTWRVDGGNVATCSIALTPLSAPVVADSEISMAVGVNDRIIGLNMWTTISNPCNWRIVRAPAGNLSLYSMSADPNQTYYYMYDAPLTAGTDSFTWQAYSTGDTNLISAMATCTIHLITNSVPVANAVSLTVPSGQAYSEKSGTPSRFTHAAADYGQTMSVTIASQPAHGVASGYMISGYYPAFYYNPEPGYAGTDSFTWTISDGIAVSAAATVSINVLPGTPVSTNQSAIVLMNTPTLINPQYFGADGNFCFVARRTGPSHGTLTVTNGTWFKYVPAANYGGSDSFTWTLSYSNATQPKINASWSTCSIVVTTNANSDWAQWLADEHRSAQTAMTLPADLKLQWRRELPYCPDSFLFNYESQSAETSVDFIQNYKVADKCRPVQLGKTLFVPLMANDSLTAYDTDTGAQKWRYYASGAVRRPPAALTLKVGMVAGLAADLDVVIFGSDDGYVYCLRAVDGTEVWKFRAAPNAKRAMGFGRLSSVWPVWASPVVESTPTQARVYFSAGFVPSYGFYTYCLDAGTGEVIWRSNAAQQGTGGKFTEGRKATPSSLGPLTISSDHTQLYGAMSQKLGGYWSLDSSSGATRGSVWDGWVFSDCSRPKWITDGEGVSKADDSVLTVGGQTFRPENVAALMGSADEVDSMLAGDGKLFVMAREVRPVGANMFPTGKGILYCYSASEVTPTVYSNTVTALPDVSDGWTAAVTSMLIRADLKEGLALVWGVGTGRLVEELTKQATNLMIVAADSDPAKLLALRVKMDAAGLSGARVSTLLGNPMDCGFAPYQAGLIASEDAEVAGLASGEAMAKRLYDCTRPFGGEIWLATSDAQHTSVAGWVAAAGTNMPLCTVARRTGFAGLAGFTQIARTGMPDARMTLKPPFRLLAFGHPRKYASEPSSTESIQIPSKGVVQVDREYASPRLGDWDFYTMLPAKLASAANYRDPRPGYEPPMPASIRSKGSMSGFDPLPFKNTSAGYKMASKFMNPLYTNGVERFQYVIYSWMRACPGNYNYSTLLVGVGKQLNIAEQNATNYWGNLRFPEIGACCVSFVQAGAGGLAIKSVGGGFCNTMALGDVFLTMVPALDDDVNEEYWVSYRDSRSTAGVQDMPVKRAGVNFGAPGDRYVPEEKMLWTHHPYTDAQGEARPMIDVTYSGAVANIYAHSAQMEKTVARYRGWVAASQVRGMDSMTLDLASTLVALKTTAEPVIDGSMTDACWKGPGMVGFAPVLGIYGNCYTKSFVKLRYDDTNLYVAGGLTNALSRTATYADKFSVAFNDRANTGKTNGFVLVATAIETNATGFTAEMKIPWSSIAAAGLVKTQLVMNVDVSGSRLFGNTDFTLGEYRSSYGPVYLDAAGGLAASRRPYTVRLYFAEMEDKTAGQRVFDVKLQGVTVLTNLDVVAQAGVARCELVKEFANLSIADKLTIDFPHKTGEPVLSGVELMVQTPSSSNSAPVSDAQSVSTVMNVAKTIMLTGSDADGNTLTYAVVDSPAHGTLSGMAPNLTYAPTASYSGEDSFTFKVNDGAADGAVATVWITVTEAVIPVIQVSPSALSVPEGGTATFQVNLSVSPTNTTTVTVARTAGDTNITVQSETNLTFTTDNWDANQAVTLAAAQDDDAVNGTATITCSAPGLASVAVIATELEDDATLTVEAGAGGLTVPNGAVVVTRGVAVASHAIANTGYGFANWTVTSGSATITDSHAADTTVTITNAATVRAQFAAKVVAMRTSASYVGVPEGGTARFWVGLTEAPVSNVVVTVVRSAGDANLTVQAGTNITFTPDNWSQWQSVTLAAAVDADAVKGSATMTCSAAGLTDLTVTASELDDDAVGTDTDGDGLSDEAELQMGRNPLVPETGSVLPFVERFEADTVTLGDINGQHRWVATPVGAAQVQALDVAEGAQALRITSTGSVAAVSQAFTGTLQTVWLDLRQKVIAMSVPDSVPNAAVALLCNAAGQLVVCDGARPAGSEWTVLTNHPALTTGTWVRISARLDYAKQTWDLYLNGNGVASALGFAAPKQRFGCLMLEGTSGAMDDLHAGYALPAGITIPSSWYLEYFGNLGYGDDDDPDGDHSSNREEYLAGTNPNDPASHLALDRAERDPALADSFIVRWQSATGRVYTVQAATNLGTGFTFDLRNNIPATPPVNVHTDAVNGAGQKFYRVKVE